MNPDYANWMRKKLWTIFQAACLAAGEEPTDGKNPLDALSKIADAKKRKVAGEIYGHAKDAIDLGELKQAARSRTGRFMDKLVIPAGFVAWLSQHGDYNIPAELVGLALLTSDLPAIYERQAAEKKAAGRYTLEEAAGMLEQHAGERLEGMLEKLMQAVRGDVLPVYEPGKQGRYRSKTVSGYYEEAYWNDLNTWLENSEPRITWRFPAVAIMKTSDANATAETPAGRRAKHDIKTERGCRRQILEQWDEIEKLYGPGADGHQVLRVLKRNLDPSQKASSLKTVQNHLTVLRKEKLIP